MSRCLTYLVGGLILTLTTMLSAQIDNRVNRNEPSRTGHALDRNPARGSDGYNGSTSTFDAGLRADYTISGNVTGLGRFHDTTGVLNTNRFRTTLPSAGLSSFQARSVGLDGITGYGALSPQPYLGRQESVADLGAIRGGLNAPASSTLVSPSVAFGRMISPQVDGTPRTSFGPTGFSAATGNVAPGFGVYQQQPYAPGDASAGLLSPMSPYARAASSTIFGIPNRLPKLSLDENQMRETDDFRRDQWESSLKSYRDREAKDEFPQGKKGQEGALGPGQTQKADEERSAQIGDFGVRQLQGEESRSTERTDYGTREVGLDGKALDRDNRARTAGSPEQELLPSMGRFAEMSRAVGEAQARGDRDLAFRPLSDTSVNAGGPAVEGAQQRPTPQANVPARPNKLLRRNDAAVADLATAARWAHDTLEEPLTTFVSKNADDFNQRMFQAEAALREGKFYRAADLYDLAGTMNPNDPLPLLGRGHALAAAGDFRSASAALQQGIKRFPQIAAFRLDLVALVGQPDVLDKRRAELEKRLELDNYYELRFLLGYLELYSGLPEIGLKDLERAAKDAPQDSIISIFPDLLLGRRELPEIGKK